MSQDIYITPKVRQFSSLNETEENRNTYGDIFPELDEGVDPIKEKLLFSRAFVVADPGYGKTRLLEEVVREVKDLNKTAVYIDLKSFAYSKHTTLDDFIKSNFPELESTDLSSLAREDAVFCFDALDEVREGDFVSCAHEINRFFQKYRNLSILLSSRWYFFKYHKSQFVNLDFVYWLIYSFRRSQIEEFLKNKGVCADDVRKTFDLFTNGGRELVISVPRYLGLFVEYLKDKGTSEVSALNRTDLFDYFIYRKLEKEESIDRQNKDIVKRVLEMLALTMEMYQTNILSTDDLTTFFDEIESGLSSFWHVVPSDVFFDKSLLKYSQNQIEFDNAEFQEFLAAKHISRLNKPLQTVFDLVVDHQVDEIRPTWFSTLTFLVELNQSFLKPLLDFGVRSEQKLVQDERYFLLLTHFNLKQLSNEEKAAIFALVFNYYQRVLHWVDWTIARKIALYYVPDQQQLLKRVSEKTDFSNETERQIQLANTSQVIGYLIENQLLDSTEITYWRSKLLGYANETNGPGVLQRHALFALSKLKDSSLISATQSAWNHRDDLVRREFVEFCVEVDPNDRHSIDVFVDAIKKHTYEAYKGINEISDPNALKLFLGYFLSDVDFTFAFLDRDRGENETKNVELLKNIELLWDGDISLLTKKIVILAFSSDKTWYQAEGSIFILELSKVIISKEPQYLVELLDRIKESDELSKHIFYFVKLFSQIITKETLDEFVKRISQINDSSWVAFRTLQEVKFSKRGDADSIFEAGRAYFPDDYAKAEAQWKKQTKGKEKVHGVYEDFLFKLEPEKGKYMQDVFSFYNINKKAIEEQWTLQDKSRLAVLVSGSILSKFDPGDHGITDSDDHTTHTYNSWISIFGESIQVARSLGMDVSSYRDRIINFIPFAFEREELESVFSLVSNMTSDDVNRLISVYRERSSDLWRYSPSSFIEAVKRYMLVQTLPLLREFVDEVSFSIYDRKSALDVCNQLGKDKEYLRSVFVTYQTSNIDLAEKANELLITEYKDREAILWRFQQLKDRAFIFERPEGAHSVGANEDELDRKHFAYPLFSLDALEHETDFLSLVGFSLDLIENDQKYLSYASYLWELVYAYFEKRKQEKSYQPINNLERYLQSHTTRVGVNWFLGKVKDLKKIYLEYVGKPPTYSSCIQRYNQIKSADYKKINDDIDLFHEVTDVIENDIHTFIKGEGSCLLHSGETEIQKQLKSELDNIFLRRNFRPSDIREDLRVLREPQDLIDKRCDFIITYGFWVQY